MTTDPSPAVVYLVVVLLLVGIAFAVLGAEKGIKAWQRRQDRRARQSGGQP